MYIVICVAIDINEKSMVSNQGAAITLNCKTGYHLILTCHQKTGVLIERQRRLSQSMENLDTTTPCNGELSP